jgi:hypothetical protein
MSGKRVFWATLLILLGLIILGMNTGMISYGFLGLVVDNWPVLLIVIGLFYLFERTKAWYVPVIISVILTVLAIVYANQQYPWDGRGITLVEQVIPEGAERLNLTLRLDVGPLKVVSGTPYNLSGQLEYAVNPPSYETSYSGNTFSLDITNADHNWVDNVIKHNSFWRIETPSGLPLKAVIRHGVGYIDLDLNHQPIESLLVNMAIGEMDIKLYQFTSTSKVDIDMGIGKVILTVPEDLPLHIKWKGGLAGHNFKELGLEQKDRYYISEGPEDETLEITVSIGIGEMELIRSSAR